MSPSWNKTAFINDICSSLDALEHSSEDLDENWTVFRDTVHSFCKSPTEPIELTPRTVRASTRKPMCIHERQRNNWHDLHSKTASIEMPGTECAPQHDLCRPCQSIWHCQSEGLLKSIERSSHQDSFKRNARNRMWTSAWPLSTLPKHLTRSVVRDFGKLWQILALRPKS